MYILFLLLLVLFSFFLFFFPLSFVGSRSRVRSGDDKSNHFSSRVWLWSRPKGPRRRKYRALFLCSSRERWKVGRDRRAAVWWCCACRISFFNYGIVKDFFSPRWLALISNGFIWQTFTLIFSIITEAFLSFNLSLRSFFVRYIFQCIDLTVWFVGRGKLATVYTVYNIRARMRNILENANLF